MSCNGSFPVPGVQRPSRAQQCGLRPVNSGSTAITANNQMQRYFDDMFDPFTNLYQRTNFICRGRNNQAFPVATQGSGAIGKTHGCRCTSGGKVCNPPCGASSGCCCPADGNPNNSAVNFYELKNWQFDDQYNPMTDLYQKTNTICRSRTQTAYPVATVGSGSYNSQRLQAQRKRRCAETNISDNSF